MKKVELLSPVGNFNTLPFAIHNGCDAVYLSGKKFGARKFADNFTDEELVEATEYCHLYGVKIYVTVNTLIYDEEFEEILKYISFLYEIGVDALIMQDIGLIKRTHEMFPDFNIHISTQCHNHNIDGINFFKDLGATRIVLDREMSLDEIKKINTDLEKEVFVHGALCVSYSGCCLFSSLNGGRSGNRGECVASCRLPYELYKNNQQIKTDGKYLLSTKELNTLNHIKELIEAGITSFKIEGRMKSSEYVGYVTRLYRQMIDKYYNNENPTLSEEDLYNLKKLYNREFTEGYLFNKQGYELMNIKTSNHLGVEIGKVTDYNLKYIKIELNDDLNQEDGIRLPNNEGMIVNRLYNSKLLLVNSINKNDIAYIDNKVNLHKKGPVLKTIDKKLITELSLFTERKIPIDIDLVCKLNKPIKIMISDQKNTIQKELAIIEEAKSHPTTPERIKEQILKLGNTPFKVNKLTITSDPDIFIPIKDLNELRRIAIEELIKIRKYQKRNISIEPLKQAIKITKNKQITLNVLVRTKEQLDTCIVNKVDNIYTEDITLYQEYKNKINIYLRLPRVILNHKNYQNENLLVTEIGAFKKYSSNNNIIVDYTINSLNTETIELLQAKSKYVTLSPELTPNHLEKSNFQNDNVEYIVYGTIELMIMKYCPLKMLENHDKSNCNLCSLGNKYYLKDYQNNKFPILNTKHFTRIMHKEVINNISSIKLALAKGINNYRIDLLNETPKEIENIIKEIKKEIGE